jgi:putative endopeptidase
MKLFAPSTLALFVAAAGSIRSKTRVEAAFPSTVTALIDETADPCEDFYQYSCGTWVKNTVIPDDKNSVDYSFDTIGDRNEIVIQEILKEDWPLVGEFWDSCMDIDTLNTLGNKPLQAGLEKIASVSSLGELFELAGKLGQTGPSYISAIGVYADDKNASLNVLYVGSGSLTLPDVSYYTDNETFASLEPYYRSYISSILNLAGYTSDNTSSTAAEDAVISIELQLANISAIVDAAADPNDPDAYYHPVTFSEAADAFPVSFGEFANGLGLLENSELTDDSTIIVQSPDYFDLVESLVSELDLEDLKSYLAFSYAHYYTRFLSQEFYDVYFDFFLGTLSGQVTQSTRLSICTTRETTFFPDLIGKYYFLKMFDTKQETNTKLMVKLIEEAMEEHIEKLSWLDDATRKEAELKLSKVTNLIGHSTQKKSYPFVLSRTAFFDNIEKISADQYSIALNKIGKPVDKTEWGMSAAEVNAYYAPSQNQMVFPAAILQPPMYNGSSHPAQNFGSIGAIIGHELTHGFDSNGRLYDGDGNQKNWWTEETSEAFDERAQCLRDEYSAFVVNGEDGSPLGNVDGNLTITENIADNGGLRLAFDAYHSYMENASLAEVPVGTEISDDEADQLFFISFAQTFCGKARDGAMKQQLTDVHSPGQWRINGPTMNNADFATAFQCSATAKMNPEKKCVLW